MFFAAAAGMVRRNAPEKISKMKLISIFCMGDIFKNRVLMGFSLSIFKN